MRAGVSAPEKQSRALDWLVGAWVAVCALTFAAPMVVATLLPGHTQGFVDLAEELEVPGRCVYVVVTGLCLLSAALRATRRRGPTGKDT